MNISGKDVSKFVVVPKYGSAVTHNYTLNRDYGHATSEFIAGYVNSNGTVSPPQIKVSLYLTDGSWNRAGDTTVETTNLPYSVYYIG